MTPQEAHDNRGGSAPSRTYRGRSLDELVPQIRRELGDDAVIVARRETTSGGLAGFFARREIEIDVVPHALPNGRAFDDVLADAHADHDETPGDRQNRYERRPPAAPAHRPVVAPEVDALPSAADVTVDDLFPAAPPPQAHGLASLFAAGTSEPPRAEPPHDPVPPRAEPPQEPVPPRAETAQRPELPRNDAPPLPEPPRNDAPRAEPPPLPEPPRADPPQPAFTPARPPALPPAAESVGAVALPLAARGVAERLIARGLRPELAEAVAEQGVAGLLPLQPSSDAAEVVVEALARRIPVHPLRGGGGVLGFVGPGGAGKTLCAARLAAAHARHGSLPVTVVALRSPDGGAELTRLLAPFGVALHAVESGAEGAERIAGLRDGLVIVDTPGVSPRSHEGLTSLAAELAALDVDELHLTVPATIGPDAARELVRGVRELGVVAMAVTHADETEQLGTAVGLAIESGLPLSYLACGQDVDAGLRPASGGWLASALAP
jgi:flagellar biosynthesis protein FlhF